MPYKLKGNSVMHLKGGKWSVKQRAKSHANAKSAMRLLQGIEHNPKFEKKVRLRKAIAMGKHVQGM